MRRNLFITFDGSEGVGKSTQYQLFLKALEALGVEILSPAPREPGGTKIGELIRSILLNPENDDLADQTELLLYESARAQIVHEAIKPALSQGKTVVLDRFFDATTAYQGFGRSIDLEIVRRLNEYASQGIKPDLTFILDMDVELALSRAVKDGADRIEAEGLLFHEKVRNGYRYVAQREPERVILINAGQSVEDVHNQIMTHYFAKVERLKSGVCLYPEVDGFLDLFGDGGLFPLVSPELRDSLTIEEHTDSAFVDGIIWMAEDQSDVTGRGEAFLAGYAFALRWGERGKDLGLKLKGFRRDSRRFYG